MTIEEALLQIEILKKEVTRNHKLYITMLRWKLLSNGRISVTDYLIDSGYKKICIYGMGDVGKILADEVLNSEIKLEGYIDKKVNNYGKVKKIARNDIAKYKNILDAVIVTAVGDIDVIEKDLCKEISCPILSLDELLDEVRFANI